MCDIHFNLSELVFCFLDFHTELEVSILIFLLETPDLGLERQISRLLLYLQEDLSLLPSTHAKQ